MLNFSFLIKNCGCVGKCFKCYSNVIKRKIAVTVRCKMCFLFLDQADKCLGLQHSQHVICSHLLALLFLVFFLPGIYTRSSLALWNYAVSIYGKFGFTIGACCPAGFWSFVWLHTFRTHILAKYLFDIISNHFFYSILYRILNASSIRTICIFKN